MHKKIPKICTGCRVSEAKIYLYHSTEIAKARPHSEEWQTDTSVQKQWSMAHPNWKLQRSSFPKNAERSTTHLAYKTRLSIKKAYMYVLKYSCASLLVCTTVSLVLYPGRVHNDC